MGSDRVATGWPDIPHRSQQQGTKRPDQGPWAMGGTGLEPVTSCMSIMICRFVNSSQERRCVATRIGAMSCESTPICCSPPRTGPGDALLHGALHSEQVYDSSCPHNVYTSTYDLFYVLHPSRAPVSSPSVQTLPTHTLFLGPRPGNNCRQALPPTAIDQNLSFRFFSRGLLRVPGLFPVASSCLAPVGLPLWAPRKPLEPVPLLLTTNSWYFISQTALSIVSCLYPGSIHCTLLGELGDLLGC